MEQLQNEQRAKGQYTQTGFSKSMDLSSADSVFDSLKLEYDPTLDDMGEAKRCYMLDMKAIKMRPIKGEDGQSHKPARPENAYVWYRAKTWVGALTCDQRNTSGVYGFA